MMRYWDLTRKLHSDMAVYPGTPRPLIEKASSLEEDGYRETQLKLYSHVGTHMDSPAHMLEDGKYLDEFPVERFFGSGLVLDISKCEKGKPVGLEMLSTFEREALGQCDFVLIDTGFDEDGDEFGDFAIPSREMLLFAVQQGMRTVGIDRMSIDRMKSVDMELHRLLFSHDVLIIENLTGLSALRGIRFSISAMPLFYENADGAPARVVARIG